MKQDIFFTKVSMLASIFTNSKQINIEDHSKYLKNGSKPVEEFCSDIVKDLVQWSSDYDTTYYKTKDFWYAFQKIGKVVKMTRYEFNSFNNISDWVNLYSIKDLIGKNFLINHLDKRSKLYDME